MKCHLAADDLLRRFVKVYLYDEAPSGPTYYHLEGSELMATRVAYDDDARNLDPPHLVLPAGALEAIVDEARREHLGIPKDGLEAAAMTAWDRAEARVDKLLEVVTRDHS